MGTDGAGYPFFSPDGGWVAFFANGKLKKVGLAGGVVLTLCDAQTPRGGSWGEDGEIVFAAISRGGLMRVSSSGGTPVPLTTLGSSEITHRWPQALPGGKAVLYTASSSTNFAMANLVVQPLPTGLPVVVQPGGSNGRYLPSGHLVYVSGSTLFAVPFDLSRLTATGPQVPLLDGVAASTTSGSAELAVSSTGTLVYQPRETATGSTPIHWMDSSGKTTLLRATPAQWSNPQFAPDGERVALDINDGKQTDVWVHEWIRDTLARLTFDAGEDISAVWTPDGRRVAFASQRADKATFNLYWQLPMGAAMHSDSPRRRLINSRPPGIRAAGFWPFGKTISRWALT